MKVSGADKKLTAVQRRLWNLREEMKLSNITGDHNSYVKAQRAFMNEYVSHPKDGLTLPPTNSISVPLFSKIGWNMFKVFIGEIFRKRTPEDIKLATKMKDIKENSKYYI